MIFHILRSRVGSCYFVEEGQKNNWDIGATEIGTVDLDVKPVRKKVKKWQWVRQMKCGVIPSFTVTQNYYSDSEDYFTHAANASLTHTLVRCIAETEREMYEDEH